MHIVAANMSVPEALRGASIALGNFDGFHAGHQAVVGRAVRHAKDEGRPAIVATFDPHPVRFFKPDVPPFPSVMYQRGDLLVVLNLTGGVPRGDAKAEAAFIEQTNGKLLKVRRVP